MTSAPNLGEAAATAGGDAVGGNQPPPRENAFLSLLLNVALPGLILTQLSKPDRLGPLVALLVAISLPVGYGIYDGFRRRTLNFFSVVGFISTLLTGVLAFPKDPFWFALKEAVIPVVLAGAILFSHRTPKPLVRLFLWNPEILDTRKAEERLSLGGHTRAFERLLFQSSILLAGGLFASGVANFLISSHLLAGTAGGTEERMAAVGKQTWITWLVIGLPLLGVMFFALWRLFHGVGNLTGLTFDDIVYGEATARPNKPAGTVDGTPAEEPGGAVPTRGPGGAATPASPTPPARRGEG